MWPVCCARILLNGFGEPSYAEHSHGCSQEVQSFKEWQKEVAVRILRTQEWRRSEADWQETRKQCAQVRRKEIIAPEIFRSSQERRTQVVFA